MKKLDELNNLITEYLRHNSQRNKQKAIDSLLDILIMAYIYGVYDTNTSVGTDIEPKSDKISRSVYKKIDGKTWEDRIKEIKTKEELERIVKTECYRDYNEGAYDTADGFATHKTWVTMGDEKVRDTHWYLDGLTVGINENFYTLDGDYAPHPFGFMQPENNVGCRCHCEYTRQ